MLQKFTAESWFTEGQRIPYNYREKKILSSKNGQTSKDTFRVFQRVVNNQTHSHYWLTMLPGFPDGSFGWARVDSYLKNSVTTPRLYIEYIGQGDSDKPQGYEYSNMERADLVEAHWKEQNIRTTFIVTFDYSSLVALELIRRQQERLQKKEKLTTKINRVLFINGGFFADAHSHPILTTPLLKTTFGKMGTRIAQKSHFAFNLMMKDLWSKEYGLTKEELNEIFNAVTRRNGALFMSNAAGFVDEHKKNAARWDLLSIYKEMSNEVSFHIVGSEKDQFEPNQIVKAKERLGKFNIDIRLVPGGHMTTSEQPGLLANIITELNK